MKPLTKVAAVCRLIESTIVRHCSCGEEATRLVSMNVVKNPERRFVCESCFEALPKAVPFEEGCRFWVRPSGLRDTRMVNYTHTVGYGSGVTDSFTSHGNRTAALKFED